MAARPRGGKKQSVNPLDFLSERLHQAARMRNVENYIPHDKQVEFHSCLKPGRLYIGGNRSGKSVGGVVEDIWWLTGTHPYLQTPPPPVRGRYVAPDFPNGVEKIALPLFKQWLPKSYLIDGEWDKSWSASRRTLTLANGSFIEFMSNDQETDAFAGTSRHFIHYDEEPEKRVFKECSMRLIDTEGSWWITMTPVEGMTWIYDDLWEPREFKENLGVIQVHMDDNPYLTRAGKDIILSELDTEERLAREEGRFIAISGLIFKSFDPQIQVIKPIERPVSKHSNSGWKLYESMDHGFNNPTAWLWHLVKPDGTVITFHEHYEREWTIDMHADEVKKIRRQYHINPSMLSMTVGDPAIKQRSAVTGNSIQVQYRLQGLHIALANNDVLGGLAKMQEYVKQRKWFITENCLNLRKEIRKYRWKTWESSKVTDRNNARDEPHKKDDHAMDSARYLFSFMPNLAPVSDTGIVDKSGRHMQQLGARLPLVMGRHGKVAMPNGMGSGPPTEWSHVPEEGGW